MLAPWPEEEGKVAKGCHSRSGEEERERQEKRWIEKGMVRRRAWGERTCAMKVWRRRCSQG
jgi:hypothetical protein